MYNPSMEFHHRRHRKDPAEYIPQILQHMESGVTMKRAAIMSGIHPDTLYEWQERYPELSDLLQQARATYLGKVEQAFANHALKADGDWRACESILKRLDRDQWGDKLDLSALPTQTILELLGSKTLSVGSYPSSSPLFLTSSEKPGAASLPTQDTDDSEPDQTTDVASAPPAGDEA